MDTWFQAISNLGVAVVVLVAFGVGIYFFARWLAQQFEDLKTNVVLPIGKAHVESMRRRDECEARNTACLEGLQTIAGGMQATLQQLVEQNEEHIEFHRVNPANTRPG